MGIQVERKRPVRVHAPRPQREYVYKVYGAAPAICFEPPGPIAGIRRPYRGISSGLSDQEFDMALDSYLGRGSLSVDSYERMSTVQKNFIQTIKRSLKRIKNRNARI